MENYNTQHNGTEDNSLQLFSMLKIPWIESKAEIWEDLSLKMKPAKVITMKSKTLVFQLSIAATLLILIGLGVFFRTYTRSFSTLTAQHNTVLLPDNSQVFLNAGSEIHYHPYWWKINREVQFEGEAYFEVGKGKKFNVMSGNGITQVLGTTFNIYARDEKYEVTCFTGKVKVVAAETQNSVIIHPNEKATLLKTGLLQINTKSETEIPKSWTSDKMIFTSLQIKEVFKEIERQYSIEIQTPSDMDLVYSGSFNKNISVDNMLQLVCGPFDLSVDKKSTKLYVISLKDQITK